MSIVSRDIVYLVTTIQIQFKCVDIFMSHKVQIFILPYFFSFVHRKIREKTFVYNTHQGHEINEVQLQFTDACTPKKSFDQSRPLLVVDDLRLAHINEPKDGVKIKVNFF